jgi:hypothetical protein
MTRRMGEGRVIVEAKSTSKATDRSVRSTRTVPHELKAPLLAKDARNGAPSAAVKRRSFTVAPARHSRFLSTPSLALRLRSE